MIRAGMAVPRLLGAVLLVPVDARYLLRKGWTGAVERAPVSESWGALPWPCARVVSLSVPPPPYEATVERYFTGAGIAKSSARIYRASPTAWG
ncbi:hypothetical protein ACIREM_42175 [Streptomyces shenzhenensis]|uniref:hypothetical protein n=1 Tax=Streptomyces shenzhenensis TaxID=943815 RepID=UPI003812AB17